jgi:hypothetical protein
VGTFHEALHLLFTGDEGPIKAVWSHADDVTSMDPVGGMQVGWAQSSPSWDKQAAKTLGGKVDATGKAATPRSRSRRRVDRGGRRPV